MSAWQTTSTTTENAMMIPVAASPSRGPEAQRRQEMRVAAILLLRIRQRALEVKGRLYFLSGDSRAGSDPVALIGAGVLGAVGTYLFGLLRKAFRPPPPNQQLTELRHIREELRLMRGDMRGLEHRVAALESDRGD